MGRYHLSRKAQNDLLEIARFTQKKWSEEQAIQYVRELRAACTLLGDRPTLGRTMKSNSNRRRMEVVSHVIFYRQDGDGIFVQRILHKSQLPSKHGL